MCVTCKPRGDSLEEERKPGRDNREVPGRAVWEQNKSEVSITIHTHENAIAS